MRIVTVIEVTLRGETYLRVVSGRVSDHERRIFRDRFCLEEDEEDGVSFTEVEVESVNDLSSPVRPTVGVLAGTDCA